MSWLDDIFRGFKQANFRPDAAFWRAVAAVQSAKNSGAITSVDQCKQLAHSGVGIFSGQAHLPGGGDRVCEYVFGATAAAPIVLPFGTRILETGTTFANEGDGTWLMADYDRDGIPDLVFLKTANTPSGFAEVHIASGASNYAKRIFEGVTTFPNDTSGTWLMADYDRDGIPDLVFVKTSNTTNGTVEVHIASGASNYSTRILETATTFANETDGVWMMGDYDHDGVPDLIFVKTGNTPGGTVEVHIASGGSNYGTRVLERTTTFTNETDGTWLMGDYDGDGIADLIFLKTANTPSGKVEVHIASGASQYMTRIMETPTTFAVETDGAWLMGDYNKDGVPDLVFLKTSNTTGGTVEVHIASGK